MCLLLGIDLLIQFFYGYDIFGHPKQLEFKSAGFFGDEYIAGGFIQRFFILHKKSWELVGHAIIGNI